MSADRGQLRTMRLLPFTAAADEAAWVADPGTIVGRGQQAASRPSLVHGNVPRCAPAGCRGTCKRYRNSWW